MKTQLEGSKAKYQIPSCIGAQCTQAQYSKWLYRRAVAHVKRDRKRNGQRSCSVADYKAQTHAAVIGGRNRDSYTGEALDWSLISRFRNDLAKKGGRKYKQQFALLLTVDHALDENGRQKFLICSWYVNDAKSDLTLEEFYALCERALKHRDKLGREAS